MKLLVIDVYFLEIIIDFSIKYGHYIPYTINLNLGNFLFPNSDFFKKYLAYNASPRVGKYY
jgi:hypothetical protein